MRVTLFLPQMLRADAGSRPRLEVELPDPATLGVLLDEVGGSHPALERRLRDESRALRRFVNFYIDGEECRSLGGSETDLADGAEVRVVPSVAGG